MQYIFIVILFMDFRAHLGFTGDHSNEPQALVGLLCTLTVWMV